MGHTHLRILRIGPKNYPPNHGGVEKNVFLLVQLMPWVENHIFTEWESNAPDHRVHKLPNGILQQARLLHTYAKANCIDIVHLHKTSFIPLALLMKLLGHRCVVTIHGCQWRVRRWPLYIRLLFSLLDMIACCLIDRVVFVGEHDYRLFRRLIPFRVLYLIRNGVEVKPRHRVPKHNGLIYLGRLSPEKNTIGLIKAAEAAEVELDLYGPLDRHDDLFRKKVRDVLEKSKYVTWKGQIPMGEVSDVLAGYRIFINPSFSEGLPTSVLEAAAQGLFLILSDIPAHRLLGFPGSMYVDPNALALRSIPSDPRILEEGGTANYEHVKKCFNVTENIKAHDRLYRSLLP